MVTDYNAYKILNQSLLNVANSINPLSPLEFEDIKREQVRLEEEDVYITERGHRLNSGVATAYNLENYKREFTSILVDVVKDNWIDVLIYKPKVIDLSEFNEELKIEERINNEAIRKNEE